MGRRLGHYGDHPRPDVADRGTPSRMDNKVAPDKEGAGDKQCVGEGKLLFQTGAGGARLAFYLGQETLITNREEGKGKPPRLFPKTGYP